MADTADHISVAPSNTEQLKAWDGDEGAYWASHVDYFDRGLARYHRPFLDAAAIERGDHVLDVGCGTGLTTRDSARAASRGSALGIDLSSRMIELAARRAKDEGVANAHFTHGDAQVHEFDVEAFDVAIGRTSAMFFGDPIAAFTNIGRALRPGARLVLLTWQGPEPNEWIREISRALSGGSASLPPAGVQGPFSLSEPECITERLDAAGYTDIAIAPRSEPMWFGDRSDDAHSFIVGLMGWMLDRLEASERPAALDELRRTLDVHETGAGVCFDSATWIIQAVRE
jgi:SAM-dependent methyltransferase